MWRTRPVWERHEEQELKAAGSSTRLHFIDNMRVGLITLVVAHHAGQPYGPTGGQWPLFSHDRSALGVEMERASQRAAGGFDAGAAR